MLDARHVAHALGGEVVNGGAHVLAPGPGHSRRDRSLSVAINAGPDGFIIYSFCGDDWQTCRDHVREKLGLQSWQPQPRDKGERRAPTTPAAPDGRERNALTLWHEARPISGTPAETYLASRGLSYEGRALRWHPRCPFGEGQRHGCLIGLVRNIRTDEPQAIHRTAIDRSGRKIGRKALGPVGGGAVKLTDDADVATVLAIGEGLESTLSIRALPDLGTMPVWSVLSAGGMEKFPLLAGLEAVWIAADHDASGTGQNAARSAGERLAAAGIETFIIAPTQVGEDLNNKVRRHGS